MANFVFQAKAPNGKFIKGEVEAVSETEARVKIRAQKLVPLKVISKADLASRAQSKGGVSGSIKSKELQVFTRQFAVLVGAGVPIVQSLDALVGTGRSAVMNNVLRTVIADVERGKRLGESFGKHKKIFDTMYVNLVKAGEEGGVLDAVLNRLAEYIEKSVKLKGKITSAMWYPAIICLVAAGVIACILGFVIPSFVSIFSKKGKDLPWLTQQVISLSETVQEQWYLILFGLIGTIIFCKQYYQTDTGRQHFDRFFLMIPVFGSLIQKGSVARFSRTLATMLSAGVRVVDALEIAAATAGNYVIQSALLASKESISKGRTITEPLRKSKHIPNMVSQMIYIGEQTGNLDTMLGKVADFYEDEVEATADALTSLIEPILMVVLGGIIATLVIAMYLPIFDLAGVM